MEEPDHLTKNLSLLGPAAAVALVHGAAAGKAIEQMAAEDPQMAALFAHAALDPEFVTEKAKCAHSGRVFRDEASGNLRAVFR